MKRFIEWLEGDVARGRKVALFSVIFFCLFAAAAILLLEAFGVDMSGYRPYFDQLVYLTMAAIGFYTGTTPGKPLFSFGSGTTKKEPIE